MIREILMAVAVLGSLALLLGILISIILKFFEIKKDPLVEKIEDVLPGANCGACGYPGCQQFAEEYVKRGGDPSLVCPVGKQEVSDKMKEIMESKKSED